MKLELFGKILATLVICAMLVVLLIMYIRKDQYPIRNFPPANSTIVAFGDSLIAGVGASAPQHAFLAVLEKRLNVTVINKGVVGDTTGTALVRLDQDVLSLRPGIVIVLLGGNDRLQQINEDTTLRNLTKIIVDIQSAGGTVFLLGVRGNLVSDRFDGKLKELARLTGSFFLSDVLGGIIGDPKFMNDEVHPNDAGYLKIADRVAPVLAGIIAAMPASK